VHGGWRLLREPKQIGLHDVYRSLSEEDVLLIHSHPNKHCPIGGNITGVLRAVFDDAQSEMENALGKYTVADVLKDVRRKAKQ
jgi:DNA-binding IscR family transcriptional regulator